MSGKANKNNNYRHGHRILKGSPTYSSWGAMLARCQNPKHKSYSEYGGRGIAVCNRWRGKNGFINFLNDMGERPTGKTLDRFPAYKTVYSKKTCRWASASEQARNRKKRSNCTSNFIGVSKQSTGTYRTRICIAGKIIELGTFKDERDAATAYRKVRKNL